MGYPLPRTILPRTDAYGGAVVWRMYTIYNTTRVDIHMACICEEGGVGKHTSLL